ncbi:MAG TPA: hypothetical protein PK366_03460 [Fibrobacteraceae bacterium]|jgi:hypothetical protein|nr:hypothetical protein [Fibrobacteraceae bacterium]
MKNTRFTHLLLLLLTTATFFIACGDDKPNKPEESSSSSEASSSSSSLINRLDVTYVDTLESNETANFYFEDDSTTSERALFYLGDLKAGSLIKIAAATTGINNDTIRIYEEHGALVKTIFPTPDAKGNNVYNYMLPGTGSELDSNQFITLEEGFYYLELKGEIKESSHLRIFSEINEEYYSYIGDSSSVSFVTNDTLRGFFIIGSGPRKLDISIEANTGISLNIDVSGSWINEYLLTEGLDTLAKDTAQIDKLLLPQKSTTFNVLLKPLSISNYLTGPYAFFELITNSRTLDKGEYLAKPDSIVRPGDTLVVVRPRNDQAKYYLRQEQYIWLSDLKKGDTLFISHEIEGYYSGPLYPATLTVLNADGDSLQNITLANYKFVAPKDGAYYLHYLRLNSPPSDQSQILTLRTFIQKPGSLSELHFYDEELETTITNKTLNQNDTLRFVDIAFTTSPNTASKNILWYVPCGDLNNLGTPSYAGISCTGDQLMTTNLVIALGEPGETASLIAESLADPRKRDTLTVYIK